jgi:transcriptional regulator with AAA-type ATPase domain
MSLFDTTVPSSKTAETVQVPTIFVLSIAWSQHEPHRIGEVAQPAPFEKLLLGRGVPGLEGFLRFGRRRPGSPFLVEAYEHCLAGDTLSKKQAEVEVTAQGIKIKRVGRCPMYVNGVACEEATLEENHTVHFKEAVVLQCLRRPLVLPPLKALDEMHPWGERDSIGNVGESPGSWAVRDAVALAALSDRPVLVRGESGTGKENAAQGIHRRSSRANKRLISLNAPAIPVGLIESELFGIRANTAQGNAAKEGLVVTAEGSTLFLDEIGSISHDVQSKMLRVLDKGEYKPLGENLPRWTNARWVVATNKDDSVFMADFLERFTARVHIPPLRERQEDIPLLIRHILLDDAAGPGGRKRIGSFLERGPDGAMYPRLDGALVDYLIRQPLYLNVRELMRLLDLAVAESLGEDRLRLPPAWLVESKPKTPVAQVVPQRKKTKEEIVAALELISLAARVGRASVVPVEEAGLALMRSGSMARVHVLSWPWRAPSRRTSSVSSRTFRGQS